MSTMTFASCSSSTPIGFPRQPGDGAAVDLDDIGLDGQQRLERVAAEPDVIERDEHAAFSRVRRPGKITVGSPDLQRLAPGDARRSSYHTAQGVLAGTIIGATCRAARTGAATRS